MQGVFMQRLVYHKLQIKDLLKLVIRDKYIFYTKVCCTFCVPSKKTNELKN